MNATIKSTKTIEAAKALPDIPAFGQSGSANELKQVEGFIRSVGGRRMTRQTKQRLAKAGCRGFPED